MKVVNVHKERYDIYIGRSKGDPLRHFGNPFTHLSLLGTQATKRTETRAESVDAFRKWISGVDHQGVEPDRRRWILENLPKLKGKTLGCFCKPLECHGDVLMEMINEFTNTQ